METKSIRDRLFGAAKSDLVPLEFEGCQVWARKPTVEDIQNFKKRGESMDEFKVLAHALVDFLVDAEGKPVFLREDVGSLLKMDAGLFKKLSAAVMALFAEAPEEAKK